jgi:hypothetical protein
MVREVGLSIGPEGVSDKAPEIAYQTLTERFAQANQIVVYRLTI